MSEIILFTSGKSNRATQGGKGAQLTALTNWGFNVPAGFIVPVDSTPSASDLQHALQQIQATHFAVRSSATTEDAQNSSEAGHYDTFLGVLPEDVAQKIKEVQDGAPHKMAVVVQAMVASEKAGVLFTANPLEGTESMMISAAWGLGKTVVDGLCTPETITVTSPTDYKPVSQLDQPKQLVLTQGTVKEQEAPQGPVLSKEEIELLFNAGKQIAEQANSPQDIEWAFANGELYILQTRPITTL